MTTSPTSMRFTEAELELIRIHQQRLQERTGRQHSATDVVRYLLQAAKPKDGSTAGEAAFRRAYRAVFG